MSLVGNTIFDLVLLLSNGKNHLYSLHLGGKTDFLKRWLLPKSGAWLQSCSEVKGSYLKFFEVLDCLVQIFLDKETTIQSIPMTLHELNFLCYFNIDSCPLDPWEAF